MGGVDMITPGSYAFSGSPRRRRKSPSLSLFPDVENMAQRCEGIRILFHSTGIRKRALPLLPSHCGCLWSGSYSPPRTAPSYLLGDRPGAQRSSSLELREAHAGICGTRNSVTFILSLAAGSLILCPSLLQLLLSV